MLSYQKYSYSKTHGQINDITFSVSALVFEDMLVIYTTHHHVINACS